MDIREKICVGVAAVIVIAGLIPLACMERGMLDLRAKKQELGVLKVKNSKLFKTNKVMAREIFLIKKDPSYLEYVARRELGMVAEGEVVVKFHDRESGYGRWK